MGTPERTSVHTTTGTTTTARYTELDDEAVEGLNKVSVKTYHGHNDDVSCCSFSSSWQLLVTGGNDTALCVWDIEAKEIVRSFLGHTEQVKCVTFSRDDLRVASGGYDRDVLVWDVKSGRCDFRLVHHVSCVECVSFSGSGLYTLVAASK